MTKLHKNLRDEFALELANGILSGRNNGLGGFTPEKTAEYAYEYAEAMLKRRQTHNETYLIASEHGETIGALVCRSSYSESKLRDILITMLVEHYCPVEEITHDSIDGFSEATDAIIPSGEQTFKVTMDGSVVIFDLTWLAVY